MQLLQCLLTESRGQALEEWKRPVRQYQAQNLDTIKAAILGHNPQDSEWCRYEKSKRQGKEKGKSEDKSKEGTPDTSNTKCSFCKGKDRPKSLTWPVMKKTMSHELSKFTMIDSDASVHVCPLKKTAKGTTFANRVKRDRCREQKCNSAE